MLKFVEKNSINKTSAFRGIQTDTLIKRSGGKGL